MAAGDGKRGRGRPPKVPDEIVDLAKAEYLMGRTLRDIAEAIRGRGHEVSDRTVRAWAAKGGWPGLLAARREAPEQLDLEITRLAGKAKITYADAQKLSMLSKTRQRMRQVAPRPAPRPAIRGAISADLLARAVAPEYGLYEYQRRFVLSEDRFVVRLKSRQIGFSYAVALKAVLRAASGRPQMLLSASQRQTDKLLSKCYDHCRRLGMEVDPPKKSTLFVAGTQIEALPPNFRTVQGDAADVIFDEFAWMHRQKTIWEAVTPSIMNVGGSIEVISTPWVPGSFFWRLSTNHKGQFDIFNRETITIHDALAQGLNIPGGLDELRAIYDADSWALMFECQWAEDGTALLSWQTLDKTTSPEDFRVGYDGPVWIGVDVGRDRDKTVVVAVGAPDVLGGRFVVLDWAVLERTDFASQRQTIVSMARIWQTQRLRIDRTGLGRQLAEEVCAALPGIASSVHFTAANKARMAMNLKRMVEERGLVLPPDPAFLSGMHAVKRVVSGETIRLDAARDDDGHGDEFWATALAVDGLGPRGGGGLEVEVW